MKKINKDSIDGDPRIFLDGSRRSVAQLPSMKIGRGVYAPGWRWSEHAGSQAGNPAAHHIGWIETGRMILRSDNGTELEVGPGDVFEVGPGHDAWVIGDEPCIAFDFATIDRSGV